MFLPSFGELFQMSVLESMALRKLVLLRVLDIYHNILFNYYLRDKDIGDFIHIIKDIQDKGKNTKSAIINSVNVMNSILKSMY